MAELFIGLMSGTSMDAIDAALVDFSGNQPAIIASCNQAYPDNLKKQLVTALGLSEPLAVDLSGLDKAVGMAFSDAVDRLLAVAGTGADQVSAIGSHGQTIRHASDAPQPYSLQIGNAEVIATRTGIDVVADFRHADIEAGGQGAPLVPAFHNVVFGSSEEHRAVVNIGGIANITILPADPVQPVTGFDTGPGNTLMDQWAQIHLDAALDMNGDWAAGGDIDKALLDKLLQDPWFSQSPPKSTGREYFNMDWLQRHLTGENRKPRNIQATLCALTTGSIAAAIRHYAADTQRLLVCGGGVHNMALMTALAAELEPVVVASTDEFGIDPDWVEAAAFAWLARQHLAGRPGNIPEVTGARHPVVLGRLSPARSGYQASM
jgi:anhydro-N-acetylmuramic acid kinase